MVVRNGRAPERTIHTGVGPVSVRRPRIDERPAVEHDGKHPRFFSGVLPRFLRRTPTIEGVVATLYLKGISTNDFDEALQAIYGEQAAGLSASTVSRLKEAWRGEYEAGRKKRLWANQYAYIWADGVYFNARVEGDRSCLLVVVGAKYNGEKGLLAVNAGYRESAESWKELLLELKDRGMSEDPKLATANVLNNLPTCIQPRAKTLIHDIYTAETEREANKAFDHFIEAYNDKYPKATETLRKDREPKECPSTKIDSIPLPLTQTQLRGLSKHNIVQRLAGFRQRHSTLPHLSFIRIVHV